MSIAQNISGMNYFCCGNTLDNFFGCPQSERAASQEYPEKTEQQDWNDPFHASYQPYQNDETRFADESQSMTRSLNNDSRSIGSRGSRGSIKSRRSTDSKVSNLEGKTLKDIEREDQARVRAMQLSESLMQSDSKPGLRKSKQLVNRETNQKLLAIKNSIELQKKQQIVKQTETSREKKGLTPEDVRDPETVPGMRCKMDIDREEESKKKALDMISNGHYPYDKKAGIAIYMANESRNNTRRTGRHISEIV
mmetsp:Transcript_25350/g.31237  ORF Transcript_25350/g.31237 Transcript_25350/m.31237 type:complete len:251 (-) Transcript_25350:129-881(-)